jgi:hypothetical protein
MVRKPSSPSVVLADGEKPPTPMPPTPFSAKRAVADATIVAAAAIFSFEPPRRAAKWIFIHVFGFFWERKRRRADAKMGRQAHAFDEDAERVRARGRATTE